MPSTRQTLVAIGVLAALLVPSVFSAKTLSDRLGLEKKAVKQIERHLKSAEAAYKPLTKEGKQSDRFVTQRMQATAKALEQANALAERMLQKAGNAAAIRRAYERVLPPIAPVTHTDPDSIRAMGKPPSFAKALLRLQRTVVASGRIIQRATDLTAEEGQPSAVAEQERMEGQTAERPRAVQDSLSTYLGFDIPDRLDVQAGAGYQSEKLLGGAMLTPKTPLCPTCESTIILSVTTTTETDEDLAKYPITLNGRDLGREEINGVRWLHFIAEGKGGPYEEYAVIRNGRHYEAQLFSVGLWNEQDRAGIARYNPAAARAFADDFSHVARSMRILR